MTDYKPVYEYWGRSLGYEYDITTTSYYQLHLRIKITEQLSILNDFNHYFDGVFDEQKYGKQDRRFRNVLKVKVVL